MKKDILNINVFNGDDGIKYIRYDDMISMLNRIEEDKKIEPKPITKKDLEAIGYAFGEMKKALQNGWDKSLKNEPFKEDKKIDHLSYEETSLWVDNEDGKKPVETIVAINNKKLVNKINEIIDVINKGDK